MMEFVTGRYYMQINDDAISKWKYKYITTLVTADYHGYYAPNGFAHIIKDSVCIIVANSNGIVEYVKDKVFKSQWNQIYRKIGPNEFTFIKLASVELNDIINELDIDD